MCNVFCVPKSGFQEFMMQWQNRAGEPALGELRDEKTVVMCGLETGC